MRIVGNDPTLSRQLTATASGAISAAGKALIVNTDGTVTSTFIDSGTASTGSATQVVAHINRDTRATFDSNSNRVVAVYRNHGGGSDGVATAVVGTVSGTSISFGTPVAFNSGNNNNMDICFDSSNNKVVIAWEDKGNSQYGTAIVGTVDPSDNSISFGSAAVFESAAVEEVSIVFDSSNNKVVIAYKDEGNSDYGTAIVGTVSGTSISFGSAAVFNSGNTKETHSDFDSTNNKVIIGYRDNGNSSYGTAIVGTVSGTSISFGTEVVWRSGTTNDIYVAHNPDTGTTLFTNHAADSVNQGQYIIGSVSGTAISFPTDIAQYTNDGIYQPEAVYDTLAKRMVIINRNDTNSQVSKTVLTMSGTTGTADHAAGASQTVLDEDQPDYVTSTYDSSQNAVVTFYADGGNNNYLTAIVHKTAYTNELLTTENFIGTSAHAAADGAKVLVNTQGAIDENQSGLTAGQTFFVDKNGALQLTTNVSASLATAVVFEAAATKVPDVCFDTTNNRIVVAYQDDANSDYGTAIVGTVASDGSISFGTPVVFESAATGSQGLGIEHDSNSNKVVIAYNDNGNSNHGTAIVGTVDSSDNSISFGSATVFNSGNTSNSDVIFDSNSNKIVIIYRDDANGYYGTAIIGTVSGTSISFGSEAVFESAETNYISGAFDSTNNKIVIAYADNADSGKGKAVVGTVSGTSISYGTVVTFENADTRWTSLAHDSSNEKTVIAYHDAGNSDYPTAIVGTVSGTDISFGTAVVIQSTANYGTATAFNSNVNKVVVTYKDHTGTDLRIIDGTVSGSSISFESNVEILDGGGFTSISGVAGANHAVRNVFDSNVNKTISVYSQFNNSSYGTAIAFTSGNDTSGSLSTDAVTAGTALSATKLLVKG
tara:strand:- start:21483 stop:24125 length:2643 start_codon:yes stop_codon:yes gene_type:complete